MPQITRRKFMSVSEKVGGLLLTQSVVPGFLRFAGAGKAARCSPNGTL